jgi:hypothetical protein
VQPFKAARQRDVQYDDVHVLVFGHRLRGLEVPREEHIALLVAEDAEQERSDVLVVLDDEDSLPHRRRRYV